MTPEDALIDRIARECAEAAVSVESACIYVGAWLAYSHVHQSNAQDNAADARLCLTPLFRAAIDRARREFPVGAGITAERLAQIEKDFAAHS